MLLPNGTTSHSRFKIPIDLNEDTVSSLSKSSVLAAELRDVGLIIWDEVPMQHKYCFEVVNRLFIDLRSTTDDELFGGVPFLLGGDFAQIPPVVPQGSRADVVSVSLQRSFIWTRLNRLYLTENMRVRNATTLEDRSFVDWISNLSYTPELNGPIELPEYIGRTTSTLDLIRKVYPQDQMARSEENPSFFKERVILSPLNASVTELNHVILYGFPGALRIYNSIETTDIQDGEGFGDMPTEFLQQIDLPSLPPSKLTLKVGAPVMLL